MDWYHPSLGLMSAHAAFTLDGIQYPGGWMYQASPEERAALGFVPVSFSAKPDDRFYHVAEQAPVVENDIAVVRYTATPRDLGELKVREVSAVKATAGALLAPSDWRVIRAAEGVKPLDEATAAYRTAVREASNAAEAAILACASVDELAALPAPVWPEIA